VNYPADTVRATLAAVAAERPCPSCRAPGGWASQTWDGEHQLVYLVCPNDHRWVLEIVLGAAIFIPAVRLDAPAADRRFYHPADPDAEILEAWARPPRAAGGAA